MSAATMIEPTTRTQDVADEDRQEVQELDPSVRRRAIEDKVLLLSPTVGHWEGRYKIPTALVEVKVAGKEVDTSKGGISTPYTVMMTDDFPISPTGKPWKKRFASVMKIKRNVIAKYSVPFQMAGARIVPKHKGVEFFHAMIGLTLGKLRHDLRNASADSQADLIFMQRELRERIQGVIATDRFAVDITPIFDERREDQSFAYQWKEVADQFCADLQDQQPTEENRGFRGDSGIPMTQGAFSQIRELIEPREAWDAVQGSIPHSPEMMRAKFHTSIYPVELATGSGFGGVTASLLAEYKSVVDQAMEAAVDNCIENVIAKPREELCEAMASLKELINRNGRVSTSSFRPVHAAIEKMRLFDFAMTSDMRQQLDDLDERMGNTVPRSLDRVTAASGGFTAALDAVMAEVDDAAQQERDFEDFGRETRAIML